MAVPGRAVQRAAAVLRGPRRARLRPQEVAHGAEAAVPGRMEDAGASGAVAKPMEMSR